ncbi:FCD domain-containing protein [Salipiger thiooxidans]|uniref:FCD domain-containing protein n=1 Tax=Salipiger thiooxidans TaxID=282683 RepID=UPI001CD1F79B|nr:FCD domain-containing protein [Salipiger thiooxidans]MCA0848688.1 FCD domain-containing protein [Salipiger thiooxidans]
MICEADFDLHYAIVEASLNKRFPRFLSLIRRGLVSRVTIEARSGTRRVYVPDPVKEQNRIIEATLLGDPDAAGMR